MAYCKYCGREVEKGHTLCDSCEQTLSNATIEAPLKKKRKKPLIFILVAFLILCLMGFSGWFGYRTFFQSPIDKLNDDERLVYDALIENLDNFNDPTSIRVLECSKLMYAKDDEQTNFLFSDDEYGCYIKLSGKNKAGGTISNVYCLTLDGEYAGTMYTASQVNSLLEDDGYEDYLITLVNADEYEIVTESETIDASKLNTALQEYCKSMGLT